MKTKEDVLEILELMTGMYIPCYVSDEQGNNGSYCAYNVDCLLDEDSNTYLIADDWSFDGLRLADPINVDLDVWAQEFDKRDIDDFKSMMENNQLYIAKFSHEDRGVIELMVWE